jgi:hypothetical protein
MLFSDEAPLDFIIGIPAWQAEQFAEMGRERGPYAITNSGDLDMIPVYAWLEPIIAESYFTNKRQPHSRMIHLLMGLHRQIKLNIAHSLQRLNRILAAAQFEFSPSSSALGTSSA